MATMNGTIRTLTGKGFGFIATTDGQEYFFHQSACVDMRFDELREGQAVRSDARNVRFRNEHEDDLESTVHAGDWRVSRVGVSRRACSPANVVS